MKMNILYHRIILKISGEALIDQNPLNTNSKIFQFIAQELINVYKIGVQLGIVIGGGNIIRGTDKKNQNINRVQADNMGLLATVINSLALQDIFEQRGIETRVMTTINMPQIAEPYFYQQAIRHFEKKRLIILAAGTGQPYFSTDTAAVLRAQELKADIIIKGTKVDGIYDSDPIINTQAKKINKLTYDEILTRRLQIMDTTAISLARDNNLPIIIFNLMKPGNIIKVLQGEKIGSYVM